MEMQERITECYNIPENDKHLAENAEDTKEWAVARRAVDDAIYKAGYNQAIAEAQGALYGTMRWERAEGRKEVVEWFDSHLEYVGDVAGEPAVNYYAIAIHKKQAKLKEWGINEKV